MPCPDYERRFSSLSTSYLASLCMQGKVKRLPNLFLNVHNSRATDMKSARADSPFATQLAWASYTVAGGFIPTLKCQNLIVIKYSSNLKQP